MKTLKFFILTLTLLISSTMYADGNKNIQFSQISTKEGLSQNTVRAILEDKKGFIWAGTLDGLNRYDGYNILANKPLIGDLNSLIDHRIKDVFQDKDGYLWIKTYRNEFSCYSPISESFTNLQIKDKNGQPAYYKNYYESSTGSIWLWGSTNGCLRVSREKEELRTTLFFGEQIGGNKNNHHFLFEDSKSVIWTGGDSGLFMASGDETENYYNGKYTFTGAVELNNKLYFTTEEAVILEYDIKRKAFQEILNAPYNDVFLYIARLSNNEILVITQSTGVFTFNVNSKILTKPDWASDNLLKGNIEFISDRNSGIWLYNHSGIVWYYNQETQKVKRMELIPADIANIIDHERYNVLIDSGGLIWITTYGNGLFCYDPVQESIQNYKYKANQNSPASDYLLSITEDRYGNIWIGSEYAGIIKVVKSNYDIRIIRPEKETSIGKNNNVRTVHTDIFGKIWVGTKNGSLYVYDQSLSEDKCIYKDLNPYTMVEDVNKRMWVGTKGKGLSIIDLSTYKEISHHRNIGNDTTSLSHNTIFNILRDNKNRMWIGTFGGGINLAEEMDGKISFRRFFFDEGNRSYIRCLYQDSNGRIWAGSSDGVLLFDPEELINNPKKYKSFSMRLDDKYSLNCNDIKTIYEDGSGDIWIGSAGGGLSKYVPASADQQEHFMAYTTADGLSGDFVSGIMEDKESNLWISTESGITKFDKKNNSFIIYQFSDKTYGNHFNENANIFDDDGYMMWGSLDGLLVFNPESFISDKNTPPVTLTSFFIYDQRAEVGDKDSPLKQSISYADRIKLNYTQNTFSIEFASLSLKDPSKNKYVYMLENYDKQWSSVNHSNTAVYKNLPPGKYIFKVRGTNSDGIWNEEYTQLEITITPPFWKSWYAYIFYSLLLLAALYFAFRLVYKFNMLNNNIKLEKELTNHKLRFFTNISHEFRTPLTLIRGAVENLNDQSNVSPQVKKQISVLSRNSSILTRLIDQLLEFRKLQNNVLTLDLQETNIVDFVREIYSGFQETAIQKKIEYLFNSETEAYTMYIDRRKIDKIIYNLLSNAFKFTSVEGKIEVNILFNAQTETCLIKVKDNGIGVDKDKQHLLFSRFMQINFSSAGTGVGLSLVKEFIDVHKGEIWYESNSDQQGSIFNVELSTNQSTYEGENFITSPDSQTVKPLMNNKILYPSDYTEEIQLPEIDDATLSNYKLLIIDDNDDIRNFLIDEFSKHVMIDAAEDGEKGLQKAIETNPDLIICDVMMPAMDGFEVTRRLKEDFQTCHIPIILLTAHSSLEHQVEGIQSGADAYIMKPFSLKYLVARVFKLIEHREQLKKRFSSEYVLDGNLIAPTDKDKAFFTLIDKILEEHLDNTQFSVDQFAELAKQRRTIFYKKVKGITGMSPNEFIKVRRLKKAAELLLTGEFTVSEISYKVGFDDPFYFSKCFKAQYNCSPSKFGQPKTEKDNAS